MIKRIFATLFILINLALLILISMTAAGFDWRWNEVWASSRDVSEPIIEEPVQPIEDEIEVVQCSGRLPVNNDRRLGPVRTFGASDLTVEARGSAVIDCADQVFLFEQDSSKVMPIASITKLATALVFLDHNPGWDTIHTMSYDDRREGGRIYLYVGEEVTVKDLFYASLVGSANTATIALVHSTGMTEEEFVAKMNDKAKSLGLKNTRFKDAVGLSTANISTAKEVATLARAAFTRGEIREATISSQYKFKTKSGKWKKIYSTDAFTQQDSDLFGDDKSELMIFGGKTGYTEAADYCFVGGFRNEDGNEVVSVVLGALEIEERFTETERVINWVFNNYEW